MKQKLALVLALVVLTTVAFAQNTKKPTLVGIHFNAVDFKTPITLKDKTSSRLFAPPSELDYGFSLSYWKGLTSKIDFSTKISAIFHDYAVDRNENFAGNEVGIEIEPSLNFRLLNDNARINPFLTGGIGAGYYSQDFALYVPAGVGIQFNFRSETYLMAQAQYRFTMKERDLRDNLFYSIGVLQNVGKDKPVVVPPPPPPVVLDRDNDGVLDADDKCPDTPGLASLQGCPDRDGDGIADGDDKCPDVAGLAKYEGCPIPDTDGDGVNDEEDKCPTVKGLARYQGCPIPDTDGDGVNDEEDKCPTVKGLARYQGCPIPDTDGDGVNDEEDKCPNRPGPASNQGCPVIAKEVIDKINFAAKNVFFATGSFKLLPKSFKSLNEVANLMKADESLMVDIDGHTDAVGSDESNQTLSDNRAGSVRSYLISQGIDESRLKSTGYGETKPVADNTTAAGRAKNRRTEMTVRNY